MSVSSVGQTVCKSIIIIRLHSCLMDKNDVLHLSVRWCAASPTNVILYVGDHPTRMSASCVGQVVCESAMIIQLHSNWLDKKTR